MDTDKNRSSAPSPEILAYANDAATKAMQETVQNMVAAMLKEVIAPLLKEVALTPEKLLALKTPYVDPAKFERDQRESLKTRKEAALAEQERQKRQDACPHQYKDGRPSVCLNHNFPDRQPRGLCMLCHCIIYPRHWAISAPDKRTGETEAYLVPAHKDYKLVLQIDATS